MFERAVLETLRLKLIESPISKLVKEDQIYITAKDEPPPTVGQYFILIYATQRDNLAEGDGKARNYVEDRIGIDITIGARTRLAPTDNLGYYVTKEYSNISTLKDLVITYVSKLKSSTNMSIRDKVLFLLKDYSIDIQNIIKEGVSIGHGFEYIGCDTEATERYPDYFSATSGDSERPAGHTFKIQFLSPSRIYGVQC